MNKSYDSQNCLHKLSFLVSTQTRATKFKVSFNYLLRFLNNSGRMDLHGTQSSTSEHHPPYALRPRTPKLTSGTSAQDFSN